MSALACNIDDVALIFEGGGMRASYSCAIASALLEHRIYFPHVYGVSASSSNAVNYVSRDIPRTHDSFTKLVRDPQFGGMGPFLRWARSTLPTICTSSRACPIVRCPSTTRRSLTIPRE